MRPATCPHCGLETTAAALGRHAPICLRDPANRARIKALLTVHDDVGCTFSEYSARIKEQSAPAVSSLRRMTGFDLWDDILAWFDLHLAIDSVAMRVCPTCGKAFKSLGYAQHYKSCGGNAEARAVAQEVVEESAIVEYEGRVLERDMLQAQCLPVLRVHPAPGLYVNGRECVRVELR